MMTRGLLIVLLMWGCSGDGGGGEPTVVDGAWRGDLLSFERQGDRLTGWQVQGIGCSAEGCDVTARITGAPEATLDGQKFTLQAGDLTVQGTFEGRVVSGGWTFFGGACCTSTGTWSAEWQPASETPDAGGADTPSPDIGEPGDYLVPDDATTEQRAAIAHTNLYRHHMGLEPLDMIAEINQAAQAHADYFERHRDAYQRNEVPGGAHAEDPALAEGFTGETFADRMKAAGYTGTPGSEVMAFLGAPEAAIDAWMATVYHRIPFVSPDTADAGYGGNPGVDVMDFGRRASSQTDLVVLYPWPGQTGVPHFWDGAEAPQPPAPAGGYPSGPVITATVADASSLAITGHSLRGPDGGEIPHVWHPRGANGLMSGTWALYAEAPLKRATTYTVLLEGERSGTPWFREWSFTTAP